MSEFATGKVVDFFGKDGPWRAHEIVGDTYGSRQSLEEPPADADIHREWAELQAAQREQLSRALGAEALEAA